MNAGPGSNPLVVSLPNNRDGAICPAAISRSNWLGGFTYGDTFSSRLSDISGSTLTVTRTDSSALWGLPLAFPCCDPPPTTLFPCFTVTVGPSLTSTTASVAIPSNRVGAVCPTVVNQNNWLYGVDAHPTNVLPFCVAFL
jgi:hypothetical protein